MGSQLVSQAFEGIDPKAVANGVIDALTGSTHAISDAELHEAVSEIERNTQEKTLEKTKALTAKGKAFLQDNAKKDGIIVLKSGLQYEVVTPGDGDKPSPTSTVRTHYHGTLLDGEVFDSSTQRGQPAEFPVNGVIAGWTEALQLMSVGAKWRLFIPPELAYGERGAGGKIGPNATLIFEVELLDIVA